MYMVRTASERKNEKKTKQNKTKQKMNSKLPELVDPLNVFDILVFFQPIRKGNCIRLIKIIAELFPKDEPVFGIFISLIQTFYVFKFT